MQIDRSSRGRQFSLLLLGAVDLGLAAAVFIVPLLLGGRIALGQFVLVALALWVAVCWCLRQSLASGAVWVRTPAGPLLLAALVLVGLQLVTLPPSLLDLLSPRLYEVLSLWAPNPNSSVALGVWPTISLTPSATRSGFILLLAFVLLFLTTVQRVRQVEDAERLIRWIAVSTLVMAVFALVQYLTSNGKFFWFYEYPYTDTKSVVKGSFTNPNHFAQFVALGIGPLVWWLQDGLRSNSRQNRTQQPQFGHTPKRFDAKVGLKAIALGFAVFVGLMSLSRGGAMVMLVATVVCTLIFYQGSLVGRKALLAVAGIGLLVVACLGVYGYQSLAAELDDFRSFEELDGGQVRRRLWQADLAGVADYPLTGTGLGSHREVYQMYLEKDHYPQGVEYTHAENGYVQVCLETGVPGLLLALIAVGLCTSWCLASFRRGVPTRVVLCFAAVAPGLAANFAHSMSDFVWYVPGCMVVVVILAACACRLWQLTHDESGRSTPLFQVSRGGWLAVAGCLAVVGGFMLQNRMTVVRAERCWDRYLSLSKLLPNLEQVKRYEALNAMSQELSAVVAHQPDHARAHTRLAAVQLKMFDHAEDSRVSPLSVRQVRDAALASDFQSLDVMKQWLLRAFGNRCKHLDEALHHARQALTLCPLQGEAYLYLADLSFLEGPDSPGKAAYVSQALRVRPSDGAVLLAAGQEAALLGNIDTALEYWRASFKSCPVQRKHLLQSLATRIPISFFLETVPGDLAALRQIEAHYSRLDQPDPDELRFARQRYAEALENQARSLQGEPAAKCWLNAASVCNRLQNHPERLRCLRSAVHCDASNYHARRTLGECLYTLKQFDEAEKHLTWCLQRKQLDKKLRTLLETIIDQRFRTTSRPTAGRL